MPPTPESGSAASAEQALEPSAARAEQWPEVEEAVGREEQIWQASQIRVRGGKGRHRHRRWRDERQGGIAPDQELPPISTRERSNAIRSASSSSSPELPSEWLPVLDMVVGAWDLADWGM